MDPSTKKLLSVLSRLSEMNAATLRRAGPDGIPMSAVAHYEAQRRDSIHDLQDLIEELRKGGAGPLVLQEYSDTFVLSVKP